VVVNRELVDGDHLISERSS